MFNSKDENGFVRGTEVVEFNGKKWIVVAEGKYEVTLENDFSDDPNYREFSSATLMFANVEYVNDLDMNDIQPFATILMKSGKDEQWMDLYKSLDLV